MVCSLFVILLLRLMSILLQTYLPMPHKVRCILRSCNLIGILSFQNTKRTHYPKMGNSSTKKVDQQDMLLMIKDNWQQQQIKFL